MTDATPHDDPVLYSDDDALMTDDDGCAVATVTRWGLIAADVKPSTHDHSPITF